MRLLYKVRRTVGSAHQPPTQRLGCQVTLWFFFYAVPRGGSPAALRSAFTWSRWFMNCPFRLSHIFGSCSALERQGSINTGSE